MIDPVNKHRRERPLNWRFLARCVSLATVFETPTVRLATLLGLLALPACGHPTHGAEQVSPSEVAHPHSRQPASAPVPEQASSTEAEEASATEPLQPATAHSATPASLPANPVPIHIPGPSLDSWKPHFAAEAPADDGTAPARVAVVTGQKLPLYSKIGDRYEIGYASLGGLLAAESTGRHCSGGAWYKVPGDAYACSGNGAKVVDPGASADVLDAHALSRCPDPDGVLPFRYGKARPDAPPLFKRLPTASELDQLEHDKSVPGLIDRHMKGAYLLALARQVKVDGELLYETAGGKYVRAADLEPKPAPPMHDGQLDSAKALPLAIAYRATELYCIAGSTAKRCGTVDKHARFSARGTLEVDGTELIRVGGHRALPEADVRVIDSVERPEDVASDAQWLHINLTQQSLVAYEGDRPVYATLVSTGTPERPTLTGLFRVTRKYLTKTMKGQDEDGPYVVQHVPWTMYYDKAYAVHGAYWHDRFGRTRSHGCVNVPPADARWLYYWSQPALPAGWHAMYNRKGPYVYVTGKTPPHEEEKASSDT